MTLLNTVPEAVLGYQSPSGNKEEDRKFLIQHLTSTIIFEYDYDTKQTFFDPFYKDFIGFEIRENEVTDLSWFVSAIYRPHMDTVREFVNLSEVTETCSRVITVRLLAASKECEWFRLTLLCYCNEMHEKKLLIVTATNVDREMRARKELEFLAERDSLTRIPNRFTFYEKARELLTCEEKQSYILIRMDVEHFSTINQLYGSNEGDNLLQYIAVKIQEYLEADGNGLYCHLEADVFGILIPYTQENVIEFTDYIQEVLSLYPLNFEIACSFGGYVITDSETPVETMFDRAYAAQKLVKGSVIQHFAYYNEELKKKEETEQRISLEMRNALTTGQFQVYLQPKCDMRTGEIIGSEELVRWVHPEEGMISPAEFIPVFERNGFISEFDHYVLEQCCQMIRRWMDTGIKIVPVSVNISRVDLYNPKLFESILSMVDRYEIPHQYIEFELTETTFVMDNAQLTALSNKLREHGFKVLMDDFGSGYSSLNCLKDLELDMAQDQEVVFLLCI